MRRKGRGQPGPPLQTSSGHAYPPYSVPCWWKIVSWAVRDKVPWYNPFSASQKRQKKGLRNNYTLMLSLLDPDSILIVFSFSHLFIVGRKHSPSPPRTRGTNEPVNVYGQCKGALEPLSQRRKVIKAVGENQKRLTQPAATINVIKWSEGNNKWPYYCAMEVKTAKTAIKWDRP